MRVYLESLAARSVINQSIIQINILQILIKFDELIKHLFSNILCLFSDGNHIKIDASGVYIVIDQTGITDQATNTKISMIEPSDITI